MVVSHLSEIAAQILRAHGNFYINFEENSILLSFDGFSDIIYLMIDLIIKEINLCNFEDKKELFEKLVEARKFELEKAINSDPWMISEDYFKYLLLKNACFDKISLIEIVKKLKFDAFLEFTKTFFLKGRYEG